MLPYLQTFDPPSCKTRTQICVLPTTIANCFLEMRCFETCSGYLTGARSYRWLGPVRRRVATDNDTMTPVWKVPSFDTWSCLFSSLSYFCVVFQTFKQGPQLKEQAHVCGTWLWSPMVVDVVADRCHNSPTCSELNPAAVELPRDIPIAQAQWWHPRSYPALPSLVSRVAPAHQTQSSMLASRIPRVWQARV